MRVILYLRVGEEEGDREKVSQFHVVQGTTGIASWLQSP